MGRRKKVVATEETKERFSRKEIESKVFGKKILTGKEVQEKLEESSFLIKTAEKSTNQLIPSFEDSDNVIFVADQTGCIVYVEGDIKLKAKLIEDFVIPGTYPNEDSILAKAIGLAIIDGHSNRVNGNFLTQSLTAEWVAIGSPIVDAEGDIIGAVVLVAVKSNICDHAVMVSKLIAETMHLYLVSEREKISNLGIL